MVEKSVILDRIKKAVADACDLTENDVSEETVMIGPEAILTSRQLVEVLLELEEFAEDELDVEFDWTSDSALSMTRSILRSIGVLVDHLHGLTTKA